MKLGADALIEIMDIVRRGLTEMKDISELLRDLDLESKEEKVLSLSLDYLVSKGRAWRVPEEK